MKTCLFIILALALSVTIRAQIPNPGFEYLNIDGSIRNWGNTYLFPMSIDTNGNTVMDSIVMNNWFYSPSTDANSGTYAIELNNAWDFTTNTGIAGSINPDTDSVYTGFPSNKLLPIQGNPITLDFYYKYFPGGNDSGLALLEVYDSSGYMIGEARQILSGTVSTYTYMMVPVIYSIPGDAAFYNLHFSNFYSESGGTIQPSFTTRMLIDDIAFNNVTAINETKALTDLTLFPDPAKDFISVRIPGINNFTTDIYSMDGKLLISSDQTGISLNGLLPGIYLLKSKSENLFLTKYLVIE
jgi:hypothetical protein